MKRHYTRPMIEAVPLNMNRPLLAESNEKGIKATISGYLSSDVEDEDDDSDGFSQDLFEN